MRTKPELPPELSRQRMVSLAEAAAIRGVSVDTLRRRFPHLIKRVSPRRLAVRVGDLLDEPPSQPLLDESPSEPATAA
jgi:hypothetical protein